MDLLCKMCREPWDNDSLHEEVAERIRDGINTRDGQPTYTQVAREFATFGCGALGAFTGKYDVDDQGHMSINRCPDGKVDPVIDAVYDLMGDDTDGAMSMFEDAEAWGLL